jgi:hypothetical protein
MRSPRTITCSAARRREIWLDHAFNTVFGTSG